MLEIPEEIKELFRSDNIRYPTQKKLEIAFYDDKIEALYPYETLYPDETTLFPSEHGEPWLLIENDRLVAESFKLKESISSSNDLIFGSCEAAQVEFTCADLIENIEGKEFVASISIGDYKMALGTYKVDSVVRQADRRFKKVTAYDKMLMFDTDVTIWYNNFFDDGSEHTLKEFRDSLCSFIGITQEVCNLPNDSMTVEKTIDPVSNQLIGRAVLKLICEINGVFGHFDRTAVLKYISIKNTGLYPSETLYPDDVDLFPAEPQEFVSVGQYRPESTYEDYIVNEIDKLQIRQEEGDIGAIIGTGDNGYIIEGNFLVFGKNAAELAEIAQNVYDNISGRFYKPHKTVTNGMPYIEVGDGLLTVTTDDLIETFVFSRTLSGIQAMRDEYVATGGEYRSEIPGTNTEIIQLQGKTAVLKKNVDEVSVKLSDLAAHTEAEFKVTADKISAEVTRATETEGKLSGRLDVTAESITAEVKRATTAEGELSGRLEITAENITAEVTRATKAEGELLGRIRVAADQISAEVTRATKAEGDLSGSIKVTADSVTTEVTRAKGEESKLSGRIDVTAKDITAEVTRAKGEETKLSGRITVTAESITSEVTRATKAEVELSSKITQTAEEITSSVQSKINGVTESISTVRQTANKIEWLVSSGSSSSNFSLTSRMATLIADEIEVYGAVTFSDLKNSGKTTINGSNITTGTIDASRVTVKNLDASSITTGSIDAGKISAGGTILFSLQSDGSIRVNRAIIGSKNTFGTIYADYVNASYIRSPGGSTRITLNSSGLSLNTSFSYSKLSSSASTSDIVTRVNNIIDWIKKVA